MILHQNEVRNRIKAVLAERNLTSKWLANNLNKSVNTVSRWCSNRTQPSLEQLQIIADVLNTDIRSLITTHSNQ
ncbi:MAG: helix-turn-helix transcriptional regulator [Muribaculaceae bacterium]|nr:helix-turn-helix transcriptional regulator [Muribaculaceae bacterium]